MMLGGCPAAEQSCAVQAVRGVAGCVGNDGEGDLGAVEDLRLSWIQLGARMRSHSGKGWKEENKSLTQNLSAWAVG